MFGDEDFKRAAVKAGEYYAQRHLDMAEPYWGGTLDANCEDKEGAWAAFQAFLALDKPGTRNSDATIGKHADVLVGGGRAFLIYPWEHRAAGTLEVLGL